MGWYMMESISKHSAPPVYPLRSLIVKLVRFYAAAEWR